MNTEKHEWYCPKCEAYLVGEQVTYEETHVTCGTGVVAVPMTHTDKQPQTCYVECFDKDATHYLDNQSSLPVKEIENVYLFTPAELEALKAEWQREAAEKAFEAGQSYGRFEMRNRPVNIFLHPEDKKSYLDKNYPLPQPPKQ